MESKYKELITKIYEYDRAYLIFKSAYSRIIDTFRIMLVEYLGCENHCVYFSKDEKAEKDILAHAMGFQENRWGVYLVIQIIMYEKVRSRVWFKVMVFKKGVDYFIQLDIDNEVYKIKMEDGKVSKDNFIEIFDKLYNILYSDYDEILKRNFEFDDKPKMGFRIENINDEDLQNE